MAIWTKCPDCKKSFSAQDDYLGKKVKCPGCGTKVEVLDQEGQKAAARERREEAEWRQEQEQRIALLERLAPAAESGSQRGDYARESLANELGVRPDRVRNFNPGAVSRFRKLRALSRFMLLGAYLFLPITLVGAALTFYLLRESEVAGGWIALATLGWFLVMSGLFFVFKFLGEMSWLLADLGDHQLDARNLLIDLREDNERVR